MFLLFIYDTKLYIRWKFPLFRSKYINRKSRKAKTSIKPIKNWKFSPESFVQTKIEIADERQKNKNTQMTPLH